MTPREPLYTPEGPDILPGDTAGPDEPDLATLGPTPASEMGVPEGDDEDAWLEANR